MRVVKGKRLTNNQADVYDVIRQFGPLPDQALVPLAQHALSVHQSSSGIRTRRHELLRKGLLREAGTITTGSGRSANVFRAVV